MKRIVIISLLVASATLAGCAGGQGSAPAASSGTNTSVPADYAGKSNPLGPTAAPAGATVFQANCVACHGPEGRGDGPAAASLNPPPADLKLVNQGAADDRLFWHISTGVPGSAMPAWKGVL